MIRIGISIVGVITEIEIKGETWSIEIEDRLELIGGTIEGHQVTICSIVTHVVSENFSLNIK